MDLYKIEEELKKRLEFPYEWGRKQNDHWDQGSSFIYNTASWEQLVSKSREISREKNFSEKDFLKYSANRWFNFWSAMAVEKIFTSIDGIEPAYNSKDKLIDFNFFGINFDHKTSVFPKHFGNNLKYAQNYPKELVEWLYNNQSSQQRHHFSNRLFLIVYSDGGDHWKLKAEIRWLKEVIEEYVATFEKSQLQKL